MKIFAACSMAILVFFSGYMPSQADTEYQQVIGIIHMDSEVSGGDNTLEMLAAVARNADAGLAIITDHDTQKATYGMWPLRNILRVSHSRASIRQYGISKYLDEIAEIDRDMEDFVYIPGIEAVPYYCWTRNPLDNVLSLQNIHRHVLIMGLEEPEQIKKLPSIEAGYPSRVTRESLLGALWVIPLLIAFFLYKPQKQSYSHYDSWFTSLISRPSNLIALPMMIVSVVFLFNNFPFKKPVVDQYRSDAGAKPFQEVIDYVNREGGLLFWAHPESSYQQHLGSEQGNPLVSLLLKMIFKDGFEIRTDPYYKLLNETHDYTGFAIFWEGYTYVGNPGGLWDSLLLQFCRGTRERPVWAIAELDMEEGTDPEAASEVQTVFLVTEKTKEAYLDALRKGRIYCFTNNLTRDVTIRDYSVYADGKRAVSGELIGYAKDANLTLDLEFTGKDLNLEVFVVSDGGILSRKRISASGTMIFPLPEPEDEMGYVRVAIYQNDSMRIATNPIFFLK
ncbi:MAG: hypothetical protein HOC71_17750 [Candidatus Latescibacteria bacterium]|jgi:hypothetical protein|nr:hypothetical protein [Candidatus Latescibacterota bacterium]